MWHPSTPYVRAQCSILEETWSSSSASSTSRSGASSLSSPRTTTRLPSGRRPLAASPGSPSSGSCCRWPSTSGSTPASSPSYCGRTTLARTRPRARGKVYNIKLCSYTSVPILLCDIFHVFTFESCYQLEGRVWFSFCLRAGSNSPKKPHKTYHTVDGNPSRKYIVITYQASPWLIKLRNIASVCI